LVRAGTSRALSAAGPDVVPLLIDFPFRAAAPKVR
jgi:hypothetical protein